MEFEPGCLTVKYASDLSSTFHKSRMILLYYLLEISLSARSEARVVLKIQTLETRVQIQLEKCNLYINFMHVHTLYL
jgi:hypothetical protein